MKEVYLRKAIWTSRVGEGVLGVSILKTSGSLPTRQQDAFLRGELWARSQKSGDCQEYVVLSEESA